MTRITKQAALGNVQMHGKAVKVDNNTWRYCDTQGATVWRLHRTDIIRHWPCENTWQLNTGGWQTVTTKDRFNNITPYRVYSEKGEWYVAKPGEWDKAIPFYDGMVLPTAFDQPQPDNIVQRRALRKAIKQFACTIPDPIQPPDAGDCMLCSMFDREGNDTTHLQSHIDEQYMHGSLIRNALAHSGYRDPNVIMQMNMRDAATRAVRKFLYRKMGLAS